MTRTITDHIVDPSDPNNLAITVLDEPGPGGACHAYLVDGFDAAQNPALMAFDEIDAARTDERHSVGIVFQNGPIAESGVNGVTLESLIAIVIDRLRSFQAGKHGCRENALALTKLEEAMHWLHSRTRSRLARGVEGTDQK